MTIEVMMKAYAEASARLQALKAAVLGRFYVSYDKTSKDAAKKSASAEAVLLTKYRDEVAGMIVNFDGTDYRLDVSETGGFTTYDKDALLKLAINLGATREQLEACKKQTATGLAVKYKKIK